MDGTAFCPGCGTRREASAMFCAKCGSAFNGKPSGASGGQPGLATSGQQVQYLGTVQTGHALIIQPKNPAISLLASFFIPGVGSIINGETGKGVTILVLYVVAIFFTFILIGLPFLIGIWIWGLVDAYQGAQRWNAAHGIVS